MGSHTLVPRILAVATVAAIMCACGDGDAAEPAGSPPPDDPAGTVADAPTTTSLAPGPNAAPTSAPSGTLPATTVFVPPTVPSGGLPSIEPIEVTEPCPESTPTEGGEGPQNSMFDEVGRLEPMLGVVLAYGGQHPDQFGTYGLVWQGSADASVFVSFTGDLDEHRAALSGMVEYPDELIVCQVAIPGEAAGALQAQLSSELSGRYSSIGRGMGAVEVALTADQEDVAADLVERYGDAVEVTVGALAYPLSEAVDDCYEPPAQGTRPGLRFEIVPPTEPVDAVTIDAPKLTSILTNTGGDTVVVESGENALGTLYDTDGRVVSTYLFGQAAIGMSTSLAPGESAEIPVIVSTTSCRADLGYVVPPGEYELIAALDGVVSEPLVVTVGEGS